MEFLVMEHCCENKTKILRIKFFLTAVFLFANLRIQFVQYFVFPKNVS